MKSNFKKLEFIIDDSFNLKDTEEFNIKLDEFMSINGITAEKFVDVYFDDENNLKAIIEYIDGPSLKYKIIEDADINDKNSEGIIWTTLQSYDDLLSIKFICEPSIKHQIIHEKDQLIDDIENGKQFAFWFENDLIKFTR